MRTSTIMKMHARRERQMKAVVRMATCAFALAALIGLAVIARWASH